MTDDEIKSMSDLVAETETALEISKQLHELLVQEMRQLRASHPDFSDESTE